MPRIPAAIVLSVVSSACLPGELLRDATVAEVANNYSGGADFAVRLIGGTGVCAGASWIVFPEPKAPTPTTYRQSIATSLLAFSTGSKVRVYNYQDDSCLGANFISISN